ncbi:kinase RLK-Pelle-CrRLK1L-1 family protein [Tanacetum coccineum]
MSLTMLSPAGQDVESSSSSESPQVCRQLTFTEIQLATQNFDESLVIGRGGFGKVYRGSITFGARLLVAAIKRLESTSQQGAVEFWAEVQMLSKLRHCHLVSLIGYCNDGQEMILVYDYMPHGTLEHHLHKHPISLSWVRRLKICIGAARGLEYLHTGTGIKHGVIHRDVKSSNILLHKSWAAKISDFGLSKIGPTNQPSTYVNTLVKGTFGYLDPDYFQTGRLTRKSDVYALGVVLFEVLCGKRAVDRSIDEEQWGLARWVQDSIKKGRLKKIVDFNIRGSISPKCLKEFAQLAVRCLHSNPKRRPTMAEVMSGLESVLVLHEKTNNTLKPACIPVFGRKAPMFVFPSNGENSDGGRELKYLELYLDTLGGENQILYPFDFDTISFASERFSEANKISRYLDGFMYKGRLQNGLDIAIARSHSGVSFGEYMNEASILIKLEHENLVQLLGYCIDRTKVFLIYEFAPLASLDQLLFDPMCNLLDWNQRHKILLGVAKALLYLHKYAPMTIIHCDVRAGNIHLNECLDPKLLGFGVAMAINKIGCIDMDSVCGKLSYMTPDYLSSFHLSTKDDVYNFGVLVLETVSGRKGIDHTSGTECLQEYIWRNWLEGTSLNTVDPKIDAGSSSVTSFIEIGLLCIQANVSRRPSMEEVVAMLLGNSSLLLHVSEMRAVMTGECSNRVHDPIDDYDDGVVEDCISELCPI